MIRKRVLLLAFSLITIVIINLAISIPGQAATTTSRLAPTATAASGGETTAKVGTGSTVKYGELRQGKFTTSAPSTEYKFTAKANDMAVIELAQDLSGESDFTPSLTLTDPKGKVIADSSKQFTFLDAYIILELPAAGTYTVTASATDKKTGDYLLLIDKATILQPGQPVKGEDSGTKANYYAYTTGKPFTVVYQGLQDVAPIGLAINNIQDYDLKQIATLSGDLLAKASLTILPPDTTTYIITVGYDLLSTTSPSSHPYSITVQDDK